MSKLDGKKILCACPDSAIIVRRIRATLDKLVQRKGVTPGRIQDCFTAQATTMAVKFDAVLCPLQLVRQFNAAKQKGVVVVGLRDVTNENEMEKALREAGLLD